MMERLVEMPQLLVLLRLMQAAALMALVLLLAMEPALLPEAKVKVQQLLQRALTALRRPKVERRLLRARRQMTKAVKELRLAKEALLQVELAEMPGLVLLPQTVEQLARMELAPLPWPVRETPMRFSTDSQRR